MTETPASYLPRTPRPPRRRVLLRVGAEQLAALLRLPDDVTVGGLALDPVTDSVSFLLDADRFEPVKECVEPPTLPSEVATEVDADGAVTLRVTWSELEGAEIAIRHEPPADADVYRSRSATVRARQWLGENEAEVRELTGDFAALDEEDRVNSGDPDATAQMLLAPHSHWVLVHDGDWVVERRGGGFARMTDEEFVAEYEPAP